MSLPILRDMPDLLIDEGMLYIAAERYRVSTALGYDADHDDNYRGDDLARAGAMYALPDEYRPALDDALWPWEPRFYKPADLDADNHVEERIRELAKAGSLIAAEIGRLARKERERVASYPRGRLQGAP